MQLPASLRQNCRKGLNVKLIWANMHKILCIMKKKNLKFELADVQGLYYNIYL